VSKSLLSKNVRITITKKKFSNKKQTLVEINSPKKLLAFAWLIDFKIKLNQRRLNI